MTSYSTLMETLHLSCIMYRFRVIASYSAIVADFNLPHLHLTPQLGITPFNFRRDLWQQKNRFWTMVWRCLRDPRFGRFYTILGATGIQSYRPTTTAYTALV